MQNTKVAIVTGASRGIGAEIARGLAADGIAVVVNYARSSEQADAVVADITSTGGKALAIQADIAGPDAAEKLFRAAEDAFGNVDILVNNAGVMELAPISATADDSFERQLAINLAAPFRLMREAAKRLNDQGRIINFSSSVVGLYQPQYGVYAATKAAIEALTHILPKELGARAITVNAIAPGPVATDLFLNGKSDELVERIKNMNPLGRLGEPQDIMQVVRFLAGQESGWINGQIIRVNGGVI
ncbi:3-ketoacyl-ACP reductase [Superficieibacter electus]|uniref:3-ketoacyl-ACP reductase n=1 Tax=Superficieibacter electus TaxID=2022662 RepID=A0A2P5GNL4_9ENTR|nr:SDR family oxidoreductase [Superficieibacter electus]POP43662.1 3-ketoacyl-ACP reductase [Superficieibacter electus]POP48130.1 3-ketoacyl-ACP reductase [Superficieibacter electus]